MNRFSCAIRKAGFFLFLIFTFTFLTPTSPSVFASTSIEEGYYIKGERFAAVYFVGRDDDNELVRQPFVNEQIYFTWQNNFDAVVAVSDEELASVRLGSPVLPSPGVVLVKIQSIDNVYALEGDELRWITSEEIAIDLYGQAWADYVIDLPPTLFPHFAEGEDITSAEEASDRTIMKIRSELVVQDDASETPLPTADNPFTSATFYVDPNSNAWEQVVEWQTTRPTDAAALEEIAEQPTARWFGDWNSDIESSVEQYVATVTNEGALPVLVAYNVPNRDCGSYSAGGSDSDAEYLEWITDFAAGIGTREAIIVLEPDATATSCVTNDRLELLADAVHILEAQPNVAVYIDAGHDNWIDAETMAERLQVAGVAEAEGFALNVSNFYTTEENTEYGSDVSRLIGDKHFIIDTSRNGNGWNGEWCNPSDRRIGTYPTTDTGNTLIDALLWIKPPGESDGTCNGGPSAGDWWAEYALGLVQ